MKHYLVFALPLVLVACAKPPRGEPANLPATPVTTTDTSAVKANAPMLSARHWQLTQAKDAQGQRIDALYANADKPLQLDFAEGRVSVGNTCNRMGGSYAVEGDQLKFGRLASTMMACADAKLMALDQAAGERLQGTVAFAEAADTLTLTTAKGDVLVFHGQDTAETRYGGKGETVFLEVGPQTRACSHPMIPDMQCLQVRELKYDDKGIRTGDGGEFGNFYASIQGYQHQPGISNVLRVKRYRIQNPPADGSSLAYELDMVVESETVKP